MIDIHDEEYVMESAKELREVRELHPTLSGATAEWMQRLWHYATGKIKWDTGKDWVCEDHPHLPYGHMVSKGANMVECSGIGMPPMSPLDELQDMAVMNARCEESLDPETFEKWKDVEAVLKRNRKAFREVSE